MDTEVALWLMIGCWEESDSGLKGETWILQIKDAGSCKKLDFLIAY